MHVTDVFEEMATSHDPTDSWEDLCKDVYFYDDLTGHILDQVKAVASRPLEFDFFKKMKVYTKLPRHEALQGGHKIISTCWLDVNKCDLTNLDYRSRLVGREMNTESRLDLFAATSPLESLRLICSICASNQGGSDPFVILSVDTQR